MKVDQHTIDACDDAFDLLGLAASWSGVGLPVQVIFPEGDNSEQGFAFGDSKVIKAQNLIDVRASEVVAPKINDVVTVGTDIYRITSDPVATKYGLVWRCEAATNP